MIRTSLVGSGHGVLHHRFDANGKFEGVVSVGILAVHQNPVNYKIQMVETVLGISPAGLPIMGPDGEVTLDGKVFAGVEDYIEWFTSHSH